ncbi:MAG: YkgJ family cysteine cluster protein, partial [Deltaproteobacteria bacterium]|nr:YkgJ family cysteine cluster protein [Deltaproteobacteria bacterium]
MPNTMTTECTRCCTCCKKGGPSFHLKDKRLVEKGIILSKHLYTIRKGERTYDNVKETFYPAPSDIIKVQGRTDALTCVFLDEDESECTIYDNRPLECRVLECWDTKEIEKIYAENRLTRKDLVSAIEGLWELIDDHQKRCSYKNLQHFINALNSEKKDEALEGIRDIIDYDARIRELVVEKGGLDPDMLDFLFGRPIPETIK